MFPEREALTRTPDALEREREEPPPDGRRLRGLAYGSSLPVGATQRAHLPEKLDELFGLALPDARDAAGLRDAD